MRQMPKWIISATTAIAAEADDRRADWKAPG